MNAPPGDRPERRHAPGRREGDSVADLLEQFEAQTTRYSRLVKIAYGLGVATVAALAVLGFSVRTPRDELVSLRSENAALRGQLQALDERSVRNAEILTWLARTKCAELRRTAPDLIDSQCFRIPGASPIALVARDRVRALLSESY